MRKWFLFIIIVVVALLLPYSLKAQMPGAPAVPPAFDATGCSSHQVFFLPAG
jgi:hypothetical protein